MTEAIDLSSATSVSETNVSETNVSAGLVPASDRPPADPRRMSVGSIVLLFLLLAGGCALRFYRIEATPVWCDELLSIHISNAHAFSVDRLPRNEVIHDVPNLMALRDAQPAWKVWGAMGGDMHPPLYYLTLRLWRDVFGDSPTGIRSLSAVLGTAALLAVFFAGREMIGTAVGLWALAINTLAANQIYYSQEARMYAFVLLWTTIAIALVFRIERLGFTLRRGAALAFVCAGAMLTLYLSSAVLFATAIYAAARLRGRDRSRVFACFFAAAFVFAIVWVPFLYGQNFHALKSDWLKADKAGHLWSTIDRALLLPMTHLAVPLPSGDRYAYVFAMFYVAPLLFIRRCPRLLLPCLAALLVVGIPLVTDLVRTTNMLMWHRYTLAMLPALSLSIVGIAWQLAPRYRYFLPGATVLLCFVSLPAVYQKERFDFRNNARVAEKACLAGDGRLVFASTWNEKFDSVLLLAAQYYWQTPPRDIVFVESVPEIASLPHEVIPDHIILFAGDRNADLGDLPGFRGTGRATWALGVGSVTSLERQPTNTAPSTVEAGGSR